MHLIIFVTVEFLVFQTPPKSMANVYLFAFLLKLTIQLVSSQTSFGAKCVSPDEYLGTCVDLDRCENLSALRSKAPQDHSVRLYVSLSQCGVGKSNQPMVCCSESPFPLSLSTGIGIGSTSARPQIATKPTLTNKGSSECAVLLDNRIFGGRETKINELPFTALLAYSKNGASSGKNFGFFCGGALINANSILTAAHCVDARVLSPKSWQLRGARLGEWNLRTNPDCDDNSLCAPFSKDLAIAQTIIHENFIPLNSNQNFDIALLRLRFVVEFNDFVKPICLPKQSWQEFNGVPLIVAGFGRTENSDNSAVKLKTEVRGILNEECQKLYNSDLKEIFTTQMCALGEEGNDSCNGDSGQPLLYANSQTLPARWELVGIVSYGPSPCGQQNKPGVYTRVGPFLQWIQQNMN